MGKAKEPAGYNRLRNAAAGMMSISQLAAKLPRTYGEHQVRSMLGKLVDSGEYLLRTYSGGKAYMAVDGSAIVVEYDTGSTIVYGNTGLQSMPVAAQRTTRAQTLRPVAATTRSGGVLVFATQSDAGKFFARHQVFININMDKGFVEDLGVSFTFATFAEVDQNISKLYTAERDDDHIRSLKSVMNAAAEEADQNTSAQEDSAIQAEVQAEMQLASRQGVKLLRERLNTVIDEIDELSNATYTVTAVLPNGGQVTREIDINEMPKIREEILAEKRAQFEEVSSQLSLAVSAAL